MDINNDRREPGGMRESSTHAARPVVAVVFLALALALSACSTGTSTTDVDTAIAETAVRVVSVEQAGQLLAADPRPVLIDVRTPQEFTEGHLADAVLVDFNAPDFADRIADFPRDGSYVIYCRSGNRSAGARAIMTDLGFTDVADIDGGIVAWLDAGLPVTT